MTHGVVETDVRAALREAVRRLTSVIISLAVRFIITVAIVVLVWALEVVTRRLSFGPVLFGRIDVQYIFDFIDFAVVLSFAAFAAVEAMKLFRSPVSIRHDR